MNYKTKNNWRIIYNNDGDGACQLAEIIDPLTDSGVDTFVLGTYGSNQFLHDTKVGEVCSHIPRSANTKLKAIDLIAKNIDPMQIICKRAHELGMRFLAGLRINDLHDLWIPERLCKRKKEQPDMLIGNKGKVLNDSLPDYFPFYQNYNNPKDRRLAWNYADSRVIRIRLELLEETINRYDIDGLELDFLLPYPLYHIDQVNGE